MPDDIMFRVDSPLGFAVRTTTPYWERLVTAKRPTMSGRESEVMETLIDPDEIRLSRSDPEVLLFYRSERPGRWLCVVAKKLNGEGFLVTVYPTGAIKKGELVWRK